MKRSIVLKNKNKKYVIWQPLTRFGPSGFYMGRTNDYYYYGEHFGRFTGFLNDAKMYKSRKIAENALKKLYMRICNTYKAEVFEIDLEEVEDDYFRISK